MSNVRTMTQLVVAISITSSLTLFGALWSIIANSRLGDRIDRMNENLTSRFSTLISTIHSVNVRVVRLQHLHAAGH
jgi:hypothetical protein